MAGFDFDTLRKSSASGMLNAGVRPADARKVISDTINSATGLAKGEVIGQAKNLVPKISDLEHLYNAEGVKNGKLLGSVMGKSAQAGMAEAAAMGQTSILAMAQGYVNVMSVVSMKVMQAWQTTWTGGIWGMQQAISNEITNAFSMISPVAGKAIQMFSNMVLTAMKAQFDWNIAQNKLNISTMAQTGQSKGLQGGNFLGMNTSDIQSWATAIQSGGATGAEKTGETQRGKATVYDTEAFEKSFNNIAAGGKLFSNAMGMFKTKIVDTLHEVNIGEEIFRAGTSMGLDAGATGAMFKTMQQAVGNTKNSVKEMGQLFESSTQAALRSGIAANIFRDSVMQASAGARMTNVDMKSVNATMTMLSKSRASMGAFGVDLASQGGEILKGLTDRSKMSAAQHANLGMEMAGGLGIQPSSTMQAYAMSKYGTKVAQGLQYSGNEISVAGVDKGDQKNAFQNLSGNVQAESLKAMRASAFEQTASITDASERLYAQQAIMKTKYGLDEPSATALLTTSEGDVGSLAGNQEFQNSMKSAQQLAAQTLSANQRQEMIQRKLADIAVALTSIVVAGLAKLGGLLAKLVLQFNNSKLFGGFLEKGSVAEQALQETSAFGSQVDLTSTLRENGKQIGKDIVDIYKASPDTKGMTRGIVMKTGQDAQASGFANLRDQNTSIESRGLSAAVDFASDKLDSVNPLSETKHSGGMLNNYAIVENSEAFTFNPSKKFHSGGTYGGMGGLKDNEVFMMSNKPVGVQTESQFSKTKGNNGNAPSYNINISITGVATTTDIQQILNKSIAQARG